MKDNENIVEEIKHQHLIIRAIVKHPITDPEVAKKKIKDLVYFINMNPVTKPQVVYVNDKGNEGLTGSINLSTSHIAFHYWDTSHLLMFDVYSCTDYSCHDVLNYIDVHFGTFISCSAICIDRTNFHFKEIIFKSRDISDQLSLYKAMVHHEKS